MNNELYVGKGDITQLGKSPLLGAFLDINLVELLKGIETILDKDPTTDTIKLFVLPPKTAGEKFNVKLNLTNVINKKV